MKIFFTSCIKRNKTKKLINTVFHSEFASANKKLSALCKWPAKVHAVKNQQTQLLNDL